MIYRLWFSFMVVFLASLAGASAAQTASIRLPAGWVQEERNGFVFLSPRDLPGGESYIVLVGPQTSSNSGPRAQLDQFWNALGKADDISSATNSVAVSGVSALVRAGMTQNQGVRRFNTVVVLGPRERYRLVAAVSDSEATDEKYRAVLVGFLHELAGQTHAQAGHSAGVAAASAAAPYELLLTFAVVPGRPPGAYVYCLFNDGSWLAKAPREGLERFDLAANHRSRPADFGTWQQTGGVITLRTQYRQETLHLQSDGTYLRQDAQAREGTYFRVPPSTGLRFEGRYLREGQSDGPGTPWIAFRADGTFVDGGVVRTLVPDEIGVAYRDIAEVLHPGFGTYRISNNTLVLSYADRRRKPMLFLVAPRQPEGRDPAAVYVAGSWLKRAGH